MKRAGVPQFQQPHVLLVGGLNLFEELCQGFKATLEQAGAQPVDWLKDARTVRACFAWLAGALSPGLFGIAQH